MLYECNFDMNSDDDNQYWMKLCRSYKCAWCGVKFFSTKEYVSHLMILHGGLSFKEIPIESRPANLSHWNHFLDLFFEGKEKEKGVCERCGKTFQSKKDYELH